MPQSRSGISGKWVLLAALVILIGAVVPTVVMPVVRGRQRPALDDLGVVPAYALTDHTGLPASAEALRGKVTIVNFIFTRCESICPVASLKMERLQERTQHLGAQLQLLSLSVDPDHDTPERLAEYAVRFHADPGRWRMLTGDAAAISRLVSGTFMTQLQTVGKTPSGGPDIAHSQRFFLVDQELHVRGAYDSTDPLRLRALEHHARFLARRGP
jgi:protein SCO1/2